MEGGKGETEELRIAGNLDESRAGCHLDTSLERYRDNNLLSLFLVQ